LTKNANEEIAAVMRVMLRRIRKLKNSTKRAVKREKPDTSFLNQKFFIKTKLLNQTYPLVISSGLTSAPTISGKFPASATNSSFIMRMPST